VFGASSPHGEGPRCASGDLVESASRVSEHFTWLDRPSYRLEHAMALAFTLFGGASDRVRNVVNGTYVGHPVHPVAATVPVGAWTVALLLDAVDALSPRPPGFREATRLTVGVGVAGSAAAAVTGLADWQYTHDEIRRAGLVHGILNTAARGLCAASGRDRGRGRSGRARLCSGLGCGLTMASSFLGGNLVYRHQVGVDLDEGQPHHVVANGVGMVLIRDGTTIHGYADRSTSTAGRPGS